MSNKEFRARNGLIVGNSTNTVLIANVITDTVTINGTVNAIAIQVNGATIPSGDVSNLAFNTTNAAYVVANAAYDKANSIGINESAAYVVANAAYVEANNSYTFSNTVYAAVNSAFGVVNSAYNLANSVGTYESASYTVANIAFDTANAAFNSANNVAPQVAPAYNTANAAYSHSNTTYAAVNSAFAVINAAFNSANNVAPQVEPAFNTANAGFDKANSANVLAYNTGIGANSYAGSMANSVNTYTSATYATIIQYGQEFAVVNSSFGSANTAGSLANQAGVIANAAFGQSNTTYAATNSAFGVINASFGLANTALQNVSGVTTVGNFNISSNLSIVRGNVWVNTPGTGAQWSISTRTAGLTNDSGLYQDVANNFQLAIRDGANARRVTFDTNPSANSFINAGNFGIGTTVPYYKLDVAGSANISLPTLIVGGANVAGDAANIAASFGHSNTTYAAVNSAFAVINAAFNSANNVAPQIAPAYNTANAGFDKANSANVLAYNTGIAGNAYTNVSTSSANSYAGSMANSVNAYTSATYSTLAQFGSVFTVTNAAYTMANANYVVSNAAFALANTALQNTSGTFNGNLTIAGAANVTSLYSNTYLDFDKLPYNTTLAPYKEGRIWYDTDTKSIQLYTEYSDFTQSMGEREWVRVRNSSGATIPKGKPVYVTGVHIPGHPIHGHHPTVALANANDISKREVLGLAGHDIPDGSHGFVVVRGYIEGIDTSALTSGSRVHLGYASDGDLIPYAPEYPNYPMDVGLCLTANSTNGTMYVQMFDASFQRMRVDSSARFGGDVTIDGDFFVLGTQTITHTNSLSVGTKYIYLSVGDTIDNANTTFTGPGLNDLDFQGHYEGNGTTNFYVKITEANSTGDYYSWSYDNFSTVVASNTLIQYETAQALSNGISVYFQANTGHTKGSMWNAAATGVTTDFGLIGNHYDTPNGYTHAGMFRDATDATFKFFNTYRAEPSSAIDIANGTFSFANVQVERLIANTVFAGANDLGAILVSEYRVANGAFDHSNTTYGAVNSAFVVINAAYTQANTLATSSNAYATVVGTSANNYAGVMANSANGYASATYATQTTVATNATSANNYAGVMANSANAVAATKVSSVTGTSGQIFSSGGTTPTVNLISTGVTATTYGGSTQIPVITVDIYGRLSSAANVAVNGMDYPYVNTSTTSANNYAGVMANAANSVAATKVATVSGTSGRVTSSGTTAITLDLATAGAGAASYSSGISAITVDAYGRVTAVTGSAGYVVSGGALGTPSSGNLSNCTFPTLNQNTTGSAGSVAWSGITGKPTTVAGYGITDAVKRIGNPGNINLNTSTYYTGSQIVGFDVATNQPGGSYGTMLVMQERGDTAAQFVIDYSTGHAYTRGIYTPTPTFSSWNTLLDNNNYNSYAPTLTGTGASGTWGINVTGNAATAGGFTPTATSGAGSRIVVADANGYIFNNYFNSTDNSIASGVTAIMSKAGDNYYRSATAAAVATFISGQSMNISGNATNITAYTINQSLGTGNGPTFTELYNSGWFRNNNQGNGLYNQATSRGIYDPANNAAYGNMSTYGTGLGSWQGWAIPGTFHFMGRSGTDFGLYDSSNGKWMVYGPYNTGYMGLATSTTSSSYTVYVGGSIYATSNITAYSDRRKKKNIVTVDNALDRLMKLRGVFYEKIDNPIPHLQDKREIGVIAQEVEEILPEVVTYAEDVDEYGVTYGNFAGLFIEAIKDQQKIIDTLTKEIAGLKERLDGNN